MKSNIFLLLLSLFFFNDVLAQDKIHLREIKTVTAEKVTNRNKSVSYGYDFKLEGETEYRSIGKYGKDLRPYIKDKQALAKFDKSMKQAKIANRLNWVTVAGGAVIIVGGFKGKNAVSEEEAGMKKWLNGYTGVGLGIILANTLARTTLISKGRKNAKESVRMQNNSKPNYYNQLVPDKINLDWNNNAGAVQVSMAWKF